MTPPAACPPAAEYEAMLLGRLGDDRAAVLEAHVEGCAACQRVLDGIAVDARLTDALRSGPILGPDPTSDPGVNAMVARLEDMARQFTPAGFDLSVSGDASVGPEGTGFDAVHAAPAQMGAYRIVRLLGAGGMGLVYLADDEALRRPVAVKVLRPRLAKHSRAREGFLREARAMAALKHDNVVTVFQVGEAVGPGDVPVPFLAMERLEGETLADWLRREGPVPPAWAARLGRQAADGLAAAHGRGVVHRDIKPGNLWLEAPPGWADLPAGQRPPLPAVARVKLLDFGLAQPSGEEDAAKGQAVLGTPAYMAPEQAAGREVDRRADLFSLGVVLYELVTGRLPFARESRRSAPTYPPPAPVAGLVPATPPPLAALIHQLLSPDPAARPDAAREVSRVLAGVARTDTTDTLPQSAELTQTLPTHRPPRRGRAVRIGAGMAVAAVVAAGVWAAWPPAARPAPPPPDLLTQPGPPDEAGVRAVTALPVERQPAAVVAKLRELNPGFDGKVSRLGFSDGKVTEFGIATDEVADIRPVRVFAGLRLLTVVGSDPGKGKLTDLSPARDLPLTALNVWQNPQFTDLSPVLGKPLTLLQAGDTAINDLTPLEGMPIDLLAINNCRVSDLTPVRTMPKIRFLRCDGCPLATLEPLTASKVRELRFTLNRPRGDLEVLERIPGLSQINGLTVNDFRRRHPGAR